MNIGGKINNRRHADAAVLIADNKKSFSKLVEHRPMKQEKREK